MGSERIKFYNMVVHLVKNERIYEENAAIKNVWQKDDNILFDIYFYRNQKSYVFDGAFVRDLLDLTNEKYYASPQEFLADFTNQEATELPSRSHGPISLIDKKLFNILDVDLIIMTFIARCCNNFIPIKEKIIYDYIVDNIAEAKGLSMQYVTTYLHSLHPDEEDFYNALHHSYLFKPEEVVLFLKECVKICLSDGQLNYREKLYLAEVVQTMRENGIDAKIGL